MDIIRSVNKKFVPRQVAAALSRRLRVMPAVVVPGARQTGKSTLARALAPGKRRYLSLDDLDVVDLARRDPEALVGGEGPVTLDEVQREPDLLLAVKRMIDANRRPGQFLLTGSANLFLMRGVSESLAGRVALVDGASGTIYVWDGRRAPAKATLARPRNFFRALRLKDGRVAITGGWPSEQKPKGRRPATGAVLPVDGGYTAV